jgi:hypothetical protein
LQNSLRPLRAIFFKPLHYHQPLLIGKPAYFIYISFAWAYSPKNFKNPGGRGNSFYKLLVYTIVKMLKPV